VGCKVGMNVGTQNWYVVRYSRVNILELYLAYVKVSNPVDLSKLSVCINVRSEYQSIKLQAIPRPFPLQNHSQYAVTEGKAVARCNRVVS